MSVLKSKVFTFEAGWGFIFKKPGELENALNQFILANELSDKTIVNVMQSESEGKMITYTFLYLDEVV